MIRKAKLTELSSVMQIWLYGNIEAHPFIPTEYWQKKVDDVRKTMMQSEIYVYECKEDHKVIGFVGILDHYIGGLFVHHSYRTLGIGKELLQYVKMYKPYLTLHVYKKNQAAIKFYQQEGFSISKEQIEPDTEEVEYEMTWEK